MASNILLIIITSSTWHHHGAIDVRTFRRVDWPGDVRHDVLLLRQQLFTIRVATVLFFSLKLSKAVHETSRGDLAYCGDVDTAAD